MCIGAALVLGAVGGQATVKIGTGIMTAVLAGAAAIAVVFFVLLEQSTDTLYAKGTVSGLDENKVISMDVVQSAALGKLNGSKRQLRYDFIIFKKDVDSQTLDLNFVRANDTEPLILLNQRDIESAYGSRSRLDWELFEVPGGGGTLLALRDRASGKEIARERDGGISRPPSRSGSQWQIGTAFAQGAEQKVDVNSMLGRLTSDDTAIRRTARDALSTAPIEEIPTIMKAFGEKYGDYRVRLGICVALTQMLRADKKRADAIFKQLKEPDIDRLLDAASDSDRTVRVYATEFLFDLGNKLITNKAIPRAAQTNDEVARYQWLFAAQGGWGDLSKNEKADLAPLLQQAKDKSTAKTKPLFDKLS